MEHRWLLLHTRLQRPQARFPDQHGFAELTRDSFTYFEAIIDLNASHEVAWQGCWTSIVTLGRSLKHSACSGVVLRVLFQPRELNLVSAAEDGEIRVWDLVAQSCLATLKV